MVYVAIFPYSPFVARSTSMNIVAKEEDEKEMAGESDGELTLEGESNLKQTQELIVPISDSSKINALYDKIEQKYPENWNHYLECVIPE